MNKNKYEIRQLNKKDIKYLRELLYETWVKKDYPENKKTAFQISYIFMYELLFRHSFSRVITYNDSFCGIILGRIDKDFKYNFKYILKILWHIIPLLFYDYGRSALRSEKYIMRINNELLDSLNSKAGAELVLFALDKNFKGMGFGKKLLSSFYNYLEQNGVDNFYLFTDTTCDFEFYEHNGFERRKSKTIKLKKETRINYIYTKSI